MGERELLIAVFDDPFTCDPHVAYDSSSRHVTLNIYESLLRYDASSHSIFPCLATQVPEPSSTEDGIEYIFPIRQDVFFHDDTLLTPQDVIYSLRRAISTAPALCVLWLEVLLGKRLANPTLEQVLAGCQQIRLHEQGVSITLRQPFSPFPAFVAHWSEILPLRWAIMKGEWDGTLETLPQYALARETTNLEASTNGTGPFVLETWDRTARIVTFRRSSRYWGTLPEAEKVQLISEDNQVARERALVEGRVDFAVCQPESMKRLRLTDAITLETLSDEWHVNPIGLITRHLDPTCEAVGSGRFDGHGLPLDALADRDLRRALALSFDYQTFISEALNGNSINHYGPFPHISLPDGPHPAYRFDLAQARTHLERAWGGEAIQGGFRIITYTHRDNFARAYAAHLLAEGFNQLNPSCQMEVHELPFTKLIPMLYAAQCPIAWLGWDADYNHPYTFAAQLLAEDGLLPQTLGIMLPRIPSLLRQALNAQMDEEEIAIYQEIAREAIRDQTYLFVPGKVSYMTYALSWHGVRLKDGVSNVLDFASFRLRDTSSPM
ncbi:MAG: ABC transporter substrate-binding protein [Ktedonobacteraceae bacterium]